MDTTVTLTLSTISSVLSQIQKMLQRDSLTRLARPTDFLVE
jgi:hypothetical protein